MCVKWQKYTRQVWGVYVSGQGQSVIDYIVAETILFGKLVEFEVLSCDVSNHFPISVKLTCLRAKQNNGPEHIPLRQQTRFKLRDEEKDVFLSRLTTCAMKRQTHNL